MMRSHLPGAPPDSSAMRAIRCAGHTGPGSPRCEAPELRLGGHPRLLHRNLILQDFLLQSMIFPGSPRAKRIDALNGINDLAVNVIECLFYDVLRMQLIRLQARASLPKAARLPCALSEETPMRLIDAATRELLLANGRDRDGDHHPVLKLFNPAGPATWLICAMEADGDALYGLCDLGFGEPELGYVSLAEIEEVSAGLAIAWSGIPHSCPRIRYLPMHVQRTRRGGSSTSISYARRERQIRLGWEAAAPVNNHRTFAMRYGPTLVP